MKKIIISLALLIGISLTFLWCFYKNTDDRSIVKQKSELYALAVDAVMEEEKGLNYGIKYICIDTKKLKDFTEDDKKQLFDYITNKHKVTMLDMNYDELKNAGYIKNACFQEGAWFEVGKYKSYSSSSVSFECMNWRSSDASRGFDFQAKYQLKKWRLKKCAPTWIS